MLLILFPCRIFFFLLYLSLKHISAPPPLPSSFPSLDSAALCRSHRPWPRCPWCGLRHPECLRDNETAGSGRGGAWRNEGHRQPSAIDRQVLRGPLFVLPRPARPAWAGPGQGRAPCLAATWRRLATGSSIPTRKQTLLVQKLAGPAAAWSRGFRLRAFGTRNGVRTLCEPTAGRSLKRT